MTIWAGRSRWPQEGGDRVGLGESGADGSLDLGRRSAEGKAFGDEKDTVLPVVLDLVLPLRVVSWHSVCFTSQPNFPEMRETVCRTGRLLTLLFEMTTYDGVNLCDDEDLVRLFACLIVQY